MIEALLPPHGPARVKPYHQHAGSWRASGGHIEFTRRHEAAGLDALIRGFQLSVPDDHEKLVLTRPLYDALYAYCQAKLENQRPRQGAPRPHLRYSQRVATHVEHIEDE